MATQSNPPACNIEGNRSLQQQTVIACTQLEVCQFERFHPVATDAMNSPGALMRPWTCMSESSPAWDRVPIAVRSLPVGSCCMLYEWQLNTAEVMLLQGLHKLSILASLPGHYHTGLASLASHPQDCIDKT